MTSASCPKQRYLSSGLQVRPFLERRGTERLQRPIWIWPLARSRTGHVMRGRMVGLKPQDMTTMYHNSNCSWQDWMAGTFLGCPWLLLNSIFILDIYIYILYILYIYYIYIYIIYYIYMSLPLITQKMEWTEGIAENHQPPVAQRQPGLWALAAVVPCSWRRWSQWWKMNYRHVESWGNWSIHIFEMGTDESFITKL